MVMFLQNKTLINFLIFKKVLEPITTFFFILSTLWTQIYIFYLLIVLY